MPAFTPPSPEELNDLFDSYEIESFIAQGGMGAVYLGQQLSLERPVAVKILPPELGDDEAYLASFEAEAKSLAKLNHNNLVGIYDFGQVGGMFYIIMEYVPGRSLYYTAHGHAVDEIESGRLISDICKGLSHAHEHDILHRDIKPANILIDDEGRPKLVDFGLAQTMDEQDYEGVVFGTPGYTAPEVISNRNQVDHRSDIFSVGVMLYELLTGIVPETPMVLASELNETDPRFDKIIQKAINPLTTLRYQSCEQMAEEIDDLIANFNVKAPSSKGTKILAAAAAAGAAPALATGASDLSSMLKTKIPAGAKITGARPISGAAVATPKLTANKVAPVSAAHPVSTPAAAPASTMVKPLAKKTKGAGGSIVLVIILIGVVCGVLYAALTHASKPANTPAEVNAPPAETAPKKPVIPQPKEVVAPKKTLPKEPIIKKVPEDTPPVAKEPTNPQPKVSEVPKVIPQLKNKAGAPKFDTDKYFKKAKASMLKSHSKALKKTEQAYKSNINNFAKNVDRASKKLPKRVQSNLRKKTQKLTKAFLKNNRLPDQLPDGTVKIIQKHFNKALEAQEKIDLRKSNLSTIFQKSYSKRLQNTVRSLTQKGNFIEAKVIKDELKRLQSIEYFKQLL